MPLLPVNPSVNTDQIPANDTTKKPRHSFLKIAYRVQMISIILGAIFYLVASYYRTEYIFQPAKSIDFIKKTDEVLAKHAKVKGLTQKYITDSIKKDMSHALGSNYETVAIDRFMSDGQIRLDSNKALIQDLKKLNDTSSFNPNDLTNKISVTLSKEKFIKYGLNQFIGGGNFWSPWVTPVLVFLAADILLLLITGYRISLERDKHERQLAQQKASDNPQDITLSWVSAQTTLDTYYRRNLEQNTWTFILSVIVMIIGFMLIFWGLARTISDDGSDKSKALVSILSTAAGIITQLIGGTFLALYNSTLKQALDYTNNLQKASTVGTSLAILNSIEIDDQDVLKTDPTLPGRLVDAKIEIAKQLIGQSK